MQRRENEKMKLSNKFFGIGAKLICISFLVVFLLYSLSKLEFFQALENKTLDLRFKLFPSPEDASENIIIIAVDNNSIQRFEHLGWPWPRQIYAACLDLLNRWGANVVAFDILFTGASDIPGDDKMLSEAASGNRTVFAMGLHRISGPEIPGFASINLEGDVSIPDSALSATLPYGPIAEAASMLGNTSVFPDPDGVYRKMNLVTSTPAGPVPSFPLAIAMLAENIETVRISSSEIVLDNRTIPLDGNYNMQINFHGPVNTYKYVMISDLLDAALGFTETEGTAVLDSTMFRDAIVIVGYVASGLYDLRPTPYSPICPGVEVNAAAVDNLLAGIAITRTGDLLVVLFAALLAGFTAFVLFSFRSVLIAGLSTWLLFAVYALITVIAFNNNIWMDFLYPLIAGFLTLLFGGITSYSEATRQKKQIRAAFSQYLSPQVVTEVTKHPERLKLGGEKRVMTCHFSDIAGFTGISEKLDPESLVKMLNKYLTKMTDIILDTGGTLDKFEGDAIIAFWGAPLFLPDHAVRACEAVLRCQETLMRLNRELEVDGFPVLQARVGLNTGPMVVGNMGSERRFDYTVIGDAVNLGSRLEGANKVYETQMMVSEETRINAGDSFFFRELDLIRVVGQKTPVRIFELMGRTGECSKDIREKTEKYENALEIYRSGDLSKAEELFSLIDDDPPSDVLKKRCSLLKEKGLSFSDWDGVFDLISK